MVQVMIVKLFQIGILSLLFLSLSACYTFEFSEGRRRPSSSEVHSQWHHIALNGLMEVSDPVNLKKYCRKGWQKVIVQRNFLQGLVMGVVQTVPQGLLLLINSPAPPLIQFYTPEEVEIYCR